MDSFISGGHAGFRRGGGHVVSAADMVLTRGSRRYVFRRDVPVYVYTYDYAELLNIQGFSPFSDGVSQCTDILGYWKVLKSYSAPTEPIVSVLMPTYNYSKYIMEAIESVLEQDVRFELVIVDDASTDGTIDKIKDVVKHPSITLVQSAFNSGQGVARNIGSYVAKAPLLTFLDSDDMFVRGRLRTQIEAFLDDKDLDIVWGDAATVDGSYHSMMKASEPNIDKMIDCMCIPSCSVMVTAKAFFRVGGYDFRLRAAEDWDLYVRLLANGVKARYIEGVSFKYRAHSGSWTESSARFLNDKKWMDNIRVRARNIVKSKEVGLTNVLYVLPDGGTGGANIATLDLIERLDRRRFNPFVYIMSNHTGTFLQDNLKIPCFTQEEKYTHCEGGNSGDIARIKDCIEKNNIGLVHNIVVVAGREAAKQADVPVVQFRHQIPYSMPIHKNESQICICDLPRHDEDQFANTYTIFNGVDTTIFCRDYAAGEALRTSLGIPKNAAVACWIGRLHRDKGIRYLKSVIGLAKNTWFIVVPLQEFDDEYGVMKFFKESPNVKLLKEMPHNNLVKVYSASKYVLNTSNTEGNGLTLIEGMCCGCVPVAFCVGGIPEYVIDGYCGHLVPPYDVGIMVDMLTKKSDGMGDKIAKYARRRFDINNMVTRIEDVYAETIARYK